MLGYMGAPEATAAKFSGDWFLTGDKGAMDADGNIAYLGRADDMMNAGGYRVSPIEVEAALASHPGIAEVAVTDIEVKEDVRVIMAFYTGPETIDPAASTPMRARGSPATNVRAAFTTSRACPRAPTENSCAATCGRSTRPSMVRLDILSDPICPWCYIGRTLLGQALAERPDHPFEIHWQPFRLNPDMPPEGKDRRAYLEAKFGGPEAAAEAYAPVRARAAAAGLEIDFDAIPRTPATTDAHRLLHWAEVEGCQDAMAMALFRAYFHDGRDISDREVLADLADSHGIDAALIARLLASEADIDEVTKARRAVPGDGRDRRADLHRGRRARGARLSAAGDVAQGDRRDGRAGRRLGGPSARAGIVGGAAERRGLVGGEVTSRAIACPRAGDPPRFHALYSCIPAGRFAIGALA